MEVYYRGYTGVFHPKEDGKGFFGTLKVKDVVTFQTYDSDLNKLDIEFRKSVDDYIDFCNVEGTDQA